MGEIQILGIVGSQRKDSYNRLALKAAQELVPRNACIELIDLAGIPFFDHRCEHQPPLAVIEFKRRILAADAILFATPECNHAVPGGLQSAIHWAAGPEGQNVWPGKPAAVISASSGSLITARAQKCLQQMLGKLDMPTVEHSGLLSGHAEARFSPQGRLIDEPARLFLQRLVVALVSLVSLGQRKQRFHCRKVG